MKKLLVYQAWLIWIVSASFYAYEFFIRISPSVMVSNLGYDLGLDHLMIGYLSGVYYWAYAILQIPVGILLDRYGTKRLLVVAAVMVALGCYLFSIAQHADLLIIGRLLMGAGSAFSFVGCLKLASLWFSNRQFAIVAGLTNLLGVIGALIGEGPLAELVKHWGWRDSMLYIGIVGLFISLLIALLVKDGPRVFGCPNQKQCRKRHQLLVGLRRVAGCRQSWVVALFGGLIVAPIAAFTELWSVPYLTVAYQLDKPEAAFLSSFVFVGIGVGAPLHGWLSGRLNKRKPQLFYGALVALVSLACVIYLPVFNDFLLGALLFIFGFASSSMILCFAINREYHPDWASGVVVGFTNMLVMLSGTVFQPFVGRLLDGLLHASTGELVAYRWAFLALPICQGLAMIMTRFIKETGCQSYKRRG
ncbi:MAG: MFS transporter [Gammaproteobacteria bacterium CG11_big_fil_rev_8_21_14_0_20_46_22]|nr:MAG: MFS transporter [Gammaproteobacteria bacterium CG12_big_fil_rev_8_21_14_0_65_46_12]PIR10912.1 MAG: MFS transporter [Gammaproteobacteria bacterium CG11_big_fil_rev_8_21_14_0_20_46_22]